MLNEGGEYEAVVETGVVDELSVHEKVDGPLPPLGIKTNGADHPPPIHMV